MKPLIVFILTCLLNLALQPVVLNWAENFEQKAEIRIYVAIFFGWLAGSIIGILLAKKITQNGLL
jgi:uncharacterized protein YacL